MHKLERKNCKAEKGQIFQSGDNTYELLGRIGDGAAGIVRKALDKNNDKICAIKILAPDSKYISIAAFNDVSKRFRREGIRGEALSHENLVDIIAFEDNNNGRCFDKREVKNPFILMEYVRGYTLESLIKSIEINGGILKLHFQQEA